MHYLKSYRIVDDERLKSSFKWFDVNRKNFRGKRNQVGSRLFQSKTNRSPMRLANAIESGKTQLKQWNGQTIGEKVKIKHWFRIHQRNGSVRLSLSLSTPLPPALSPASFIISLFLLFDSYVCVCVLFAFELFISWPMAFNFHNSSAYCWLAPLSCSFVQMLWTGQMRAIHLKRLSYLVRLICWCDVCDWVQLGIHLNEYSIRPLAYGWEHFGWF